MHINNSIFKLVVEKSVSLATRCRIAFNLYMKNCRCVTHRTNWFPTWIWRLTNRHANTLTSLQRYVSFSRLRLSVHAFICKKQDQIWAKIFCIPKNRHSRTPMHILQHPIACIARSLSIAQFHANIQFDIYKKSHLCVTIKGDCTTGVSILDLLHS